MNKEELNKIKEVLLAGGVIAFPTETVMGLGVIYDDYDAYLRLNEIKRRPEDKPYTMMLGSVEDIGKYAYISTRDKRIISRFMPGSITVLLKAKENVPGYVTHNTGIIGIRIPTNEEAVELLKALDKPLLVPSANISGQAPALNSLEARNTFKDKVKAYIDGDCLGGKPSTIIDLSSDEPKLLRKGPILFEEIKCVYYGHK